MNTHFRVEIRDDGIVWLTRLDQAYEHLDQIRSAYADILGQVDSAMTVLRMRHVARRGVFPLGWLYDVRHAPSRNDPRFERAQADCRPMLLERSPILCTLCQTSAGKMQVERISSAYEDWRVCIDEAEAIQWLRTRITKG